MTGEPDSLEGGQLYLPHLHRVSTELVGRRREGRGGGEREEGRGGEERGEGRGGEGRGEGRGRKEREKQVQAPHVDCRYMYMYVHA